MRITSTSSYIIGILALIAVAGCFQKDPRTRIQGAISTLTSDTSASGKAAACDTLFAALAEIPADAPDRKDLASRATTTLEAVALGTNQEVRDAAVRHLAELDGYLQSTLVVLFKSEDEAVRERAEKILTAMGPSVTPDLGLFYISILEAFEDQDLAPGGYSFKVDLTPGSYDPYEGVPGMKRMSESGEKRMMAFVRIFGKVGDKSSVIALFAGATSIRQGHPHFAEENLKALVALGPDKVALLPDNAKSIYQALTTPPHK